MTILANRERLMFYGSFNLCEIVMQDISLISGRSLAQDENLIHGRVLMLKFYKELCF